MSDTRIHGKIVFICDGCGDELETESTTFLEALSDKRAADWGSRRDKYQKWEDVCKGCKS